MKNLIFFFLMFCITKVGAQTNVGIGTTTPDASAKLEVESSTQGLLIPRMTETQRNAINSPATSLTIYQTDNTSGFYFFDGTSWNMIGDNFGTHLASQIVDMDTNRIVNVSAPINGLDAVNKDYVDAAVASGGGGGATIGSGMPTEISAQSSATMNIGTAFVYCDTLTEGGNVDWIAPTFTQLTYAVSGGCVLPGTRSGDYLWTRNESNFNGTSHYYSTMRLNDGDINIYAGSSTTQYIRCVR